MKIVTDKSTDSKIAIVYSDEIILTGAQSALDFISLINYETGCDKIILNKSAITEDFFNLSSCLAGEILQKFVNYHITIAIVGDFSMYKSKNLQDFIYESNKGKHIFFLSTNRQAIEKLSIV